MKISECLREMHGLIEIKGWTRGCHAKDASGVSIPPTSPEAVCWCLEGAVLAEKSAIFAPGDFRLAMSALADQIPVESRFGDFAGQQVIRYNDVILTSQQEALEWIDKAIAKETENETK